MARRYAMWLLGTGWLCAVGMGAAQLVRFESTPCQSAAAKSEWPTQSKLSLTPDVYNLLVFAHPRCPCTRATLGELAELTARCRDRVQVRVVLFKPADVPDDWVHTDQWRSASEIPGVQVLCDEAGAEAERFGAV